MNRPIVEPPAKRQQPPTGARRRLAAAAVVLLTLLGAALVVERAAYARQWLWQTTAGPEQRLRFEFDVANAMNIGRSTVLLAAERAGVDPREVTWRQLLDGYLHRYAYEAATHEGRRPHIDYPPGRLLIVSLWMKGIIAEHGPYVGYADEHVAPMLRLNFACELVSAACVMAIVVSHLARRGHSLFTTAPLALAAAALLLFNPALMLNSHAWPQWDVWVLPPVLIALLAAMHDRWLLAGLVLGAGAFFKGQTLLIVPVMIAWPILQWRLDRLFTLVSGLLGGAVVMASPWLLGPREAFTHVASVAPLALLLAYWPWRRKLSAWWWSVALVTLAVAVAPWVEPGHLRGATLPAILTILVAVASIELRGERRTAVFLLMLSLLALAAAGRFDAPTDWLTIGFPTDRYMAMSMGPTSNLPAILGQTFRFDVEELVLWQWLPLRRVLQALAYAGAVLCAVGLARGCGSASFLAGAVGPWVVLFAMLPQMHERYLLWAAAVSVLLVAQNVPGLLTHLAITLVAAGQQLISMIQANPRPRDAGFGPDLFGWTELEVLRALGRAEPHIGWAVLVLAAVLITQAVGRREPRATLTRGANPAE